MIPSPLYIVTGGQTGVDRAALDAALSLKLPVRGWCPLGRLAEDGRIPDIYPLRETYSPDVIIRTEWNVRDSTGTFILTFTEELTGGTLATYQFTQQYHRPCFIIDAMKFNPDDYCQASNDLQQWIKLHQINILNIAGPRESDNPGIIYTKSKRILDLLLAPYAHGK